MKYQVGDKASFTKTITETDVYLFAGVTGDLNPAHVNETWAKNTKFGGRIAHGMLSGGLISAVLGMQLPGPGSIYMGQTLKFTAPVHIGDTVTAAAEVVEIIDGKRLRLHTTATRQDGTLVVDGEALVLPPRD
ncbi:MAG TPA: MaoC family dehydratase [Symbiobacteriaceae bacterium]|nr:MaoC family dehydratase [Symbiobacteriaceae bacterium]